MPFEPGHQLSVGPKKRQVYDSMMREVIQNPAKLKEACAKVLDAAASGDLDALDWIACRLEGKPAPVNPDTGDTVPDVTLIKMVVMQPNPSLINGLGRVEKEILSQEKESLTPLPTPPRSVIAEHGGTSE